MTHTVLEKNKVNTEEFIQHCSDFQLGSYAGTEAARLWDELIGIKNFMKKLKNPTPLNVLI